MYVYARKRICLSKLILHTEHTMRHCIIISALHVSMSHFICLIFAYLSRADEAMKF